MKSLNMQPDRSDFVNLYFPAMRSMCSSSSEGRSGDILLAGKVEEEEYTTAEAKAVTASENHKEAEKRRRQRINSHLDTLRSLLPSDSKRDKASVLGKVVERLRELKEKSREDDLELDGDDIMVVSSRRSEDESLIIKASFCCEDRWDLIPELIQTLKSVGLSPLKAEMVTYGGRIRNVLMVSSSKTKDEEQVVELLKQGLRSLVQPSTTTTSHHHHHHHNNHSFKRQRTLSYS